MRKIIPIAIGVFVLMVVLQKFHRSAPQDASSQRATSNPATMDVAPNKQAAHVNDARSTWPPLSEDGGPTSPSSSINYYIVFDGSGSMLSHECGDGTSKIEAAVHAVKNFVAAVPAAANIGLAAFDRRDISERVALGIGNRDALVDALQEIHAGSNTPLRSSIKIGYDKLTEQARTQLGYGEYHLIVVTDGRPDPRSEDPTPIVHEILAQSPVVLHTIGFCINEYHVLNQQGRTYYASATNPQQLQQSLQAVLAEAPVFDAAKFQ